MTVLKGLIKPLEKFVSIGELNNITLIGDPGCDGLGASTMSIFAKALNVKNSDLNIIVGDIVPFGSRQLYKNVEEFINTLAEKPVYTLCGNHDTDFYKEYFGLEDYCLCNSELTIISLDNSKRDFSEYTLNFCQEVLAGCKTENVIILFHIPPPNSFTGNSVSPENWNKLRVLIEPYKNKVKYLICGHVHSYFEDVVDEIPLIVTGGGGARIEFVSERVEKNNIHNHVVQLYFDHERKLKHKYINVENMSFNPELKDQKLCEYLNNAFRNEAIAHFKYKLFSELSKEREKPGLSSLFKALSDSEYYHAKNHYSVMNELKAMNEFIKDSIQAESYEINTMYKDYLEYAESNSLGLAKYSFFDSLEAEKVHKPLLEKALELYSCDKDFDSAMFFTCTSCGYTFNSETQPKRCPVCGAPQDKIKEIV